MGKNYYYYYFSRTKKQPTALLLAAGFCPIIRWNMGENMAFLVHAPISLWPCCLLKSFGEGLGGKMGEKVAF